MHGNEQYKKREHYASRLRTLTILWLCVAVAPCPCSRVPMALCP
jgi:hypothetical protein